MARISTRPRRSSPLYLTGAFALFGQSRRLVWKHRWIFGPLYLIPFIFAFHSWEWTPAPDSHNGRPWWTDYSWFGSGFSASSVPTYMWYAIVGSSLLWLVLVMVFGVITQIMSQQAQLEAASGHQVIAFDKLWPIVKRAAWEMFGLYLIIGLYVVSPLALWVILYWMLGASALIFFPLGIVSLIMVRRYFLAPYFMLDKKMGITEAMDTSAEITKAYSYSIWSIIGVMVLVGLLNIIPAIGWFIAFILGSLYSAAPALRYHELKKLVT